MRYFILMIFLCGLVSACQHSPRKNYYVLSTPAAAPNTSAEAISTLIGIGPIEVAEYLNRSHIVYQDQGGSLIMASNDYWAEPLHKGIPRVLALHLTQRDPSRSAVNFPWRMDSTPPYSLRLSVHSFHRINGQAHINATWELVDNTAKTNLLRRHFIRSTSVNSGAQSLAAAFSQLLAELAGEMDQALQQHTTEN